MGTSDDVAKAYAAVRNETINNPDLSNSQKIAVVELVKHELLEDALAEVRRESMNR